MNDLMTLEDIAALWKVKREHARRYIVKLPEFPDPAPGSTRKNQRWRSDQVLEFLGQTEAVPT
jgi:hypothetical protein